MGSARPPDAVAICTSFDYIETAEGFATVLSARNKIYPSKRAIFKEVLLCNIAPDGTAPVISLAVCIKGVMVQLVSNVALDDAITLLANFSVTAMSETDYVQLSSSVANAVSALVTFG